MQRSRGVRIVLVDTSEGEAAAVEDDEPESKRYAKELEEHPHLDDARPRQAPPPRDEPAGEGAAAAHGNRHHAHQDRGERGREAVLRLEKPEGTEFHLSCINGWILFPGTFSIQTSGKTRFIHNQRPKWDALIRKTFVQWRYSLGQKC